MILKIRSCGNFFKISKFLKPFRGYSNLFENPEYSSSYLSHWIKYPRELFGIFDSKLQSSTDLLDANLKKQYGRGDDGLWKQAVDVGCGNGNSTEPLNSYFKETLGVDLSKSQVDMAIKMYGGSKGLSFKVADASALSALMPESSVDLVTASVALHWLDRQKFYQDCLKVLRPGGLLAVFSHEFHQHDNSQAQEYLMELITKDSIGHIGDVEEIMIARYRLFETELKQVFSSVERDESFRIEKKIPMSVYKAYLKCWPSYVQFKISQPDSPDPVDKYIERLSSLTDSREIDYKTTVYCLFCKKA